MEEIKEIIVENGISLKSIYRNAYAIKYDTLEQLIPMFKQNNVIILGGDIFFRNEDDIEFANAFWSYNTDLLSSKEKNVTRSISRMQYYLTKHFQDNLYEILITLDTKPPLFYVSIE